MAQKTDWLPSDRTGQLTRCKDWLSVLTTGGKAAAWGVPQSRITELTAAAASAETALATAQTETTRTPVATADCRAVFHAMVELMRDTKRRYFLTPPLVDPTDYISLGLKPRDTVHTVSGTPTAQVGQKALGFLSRSLRKAQTPHNYPLDIIGWSFAKQNSQAIRRSRIARHELGIKIVYVTGSPVDPANKGFRVYYKVVAPGSAPPTAPGELIKSLYTKRKKDLMEFEFGDSGKTAYFAVQIENEGKKGPWGPMISALIP